MVYTRLILPYKPAISILGKIMIEIISYLQRRDNDPKVRLMVTDSQTIQP